VQGEKTHTEANTLGELKSM